MADQGHIETEKVLADIEREIYKEYSQAEKELAEKIEDYFARFEKKKAIKLKALSEGKITQEEYDKWLIGQLAMGDRWKEMKETIAHDLGHASEMAMAISAGHMPEVYAINHDYGTFQVEKASLVDTSYTLYDRNTARRLFEDEHQFYHDHGWKVGKHINEGKLIPWEKKQAQSVLTQALLQGESIGKIATRLQNAFGNSILEEDIKNRDKMTAEQIAKELARRNRNASIRNARTMTTGVQNAGRVDSYKRADGMGIKLKQEWLATLDGRTRHEHRLLDGQRVAVGDKFEVDGYELEYPGDPRGEAFLVYNCRCTLVPVLAGFEVDPSDTTLRHNAYLEEESYDEWKKNHASHSDPITKQDDIERTMKNAYNKEYSNYADGKFVPNKNDLLKAPSSSLGNADKVLNDDLSQLSNDYLARMNAEDANKFKKILSRADFEESTDGSEYNPRENKIYIDKSKASDWTAFHESTHWFDFNTHYKITEDWGHYEYDADGNKTKWVSKIVTIKNDAAFSEYISHKWNAMDGAKVRTMASDDLKNFVKIIGMSDTYGNNRSAKDIVHDISAVNQYLASKGISKTDPDFPHLSDFLSAISYESSGTKPTGGHDYDYWTYSDTNRVAEVTAGYNLLKALGREDFIQIERELAPNLMKLIEEEWSKIW